MAEMSNMMIDQSNQNDEPLIVGSNITFDYQISEAQSNLTYAKDTQPLAVGTNLTIEITYSEAEQLESLGINLDQINDLGTNITIIGDESESDWLERQDNNPLYGGGMLSGDSTNSDYSWEMDETDDTAPADGDAESIANEDGFLGDGSKPLIVGSNVTFVIKSSEEETVANGENSTSSKDNSVTQSQPFALGTNLFLELPNDQQADSYLGSNQSTFGENNQSNTMNEDSFSGNMMPDGMGEQSTDSMDSGSFTGGMMFGGMGEQPNGNSQEDAFTGGMMFGGMSEQPTDNTDGPSFGSGMMPGGMGEQPTDNSQEDAFTGGMGEQPNGNSQEDAFTGGMMFGGMGEQPSENTDGPSFGAGMMFGGFGNQPAEENNDDNYAWDFGGQLDRFATDSGETDLEALFKSSPWGSLSEVGVDSFEDVFPNVPNNPDENPLMGSFGGQAIV